MFNALVKLINQQKQKSKKGFTLVELIVVIAILGILAALVVPSVSGYVKKAQEATDEANAQMLFSAGQLYVMDKEIAGKPLAVNATFTEAALISDGYIQKDPGGDATFTVLTAGSGTTKTTIKLEYKGTTKSITLPDATAVTPPKADTKG